jgi:hypothetical protein
VPPYLIDTKDVITSKDYMKNICEKLMGEAAERFSAVCVPLAIFCGD